MNAVASPPRAASRAASAVAGTPGESIAAAPRLADPPAVRAAAEVATRTTATVHTVTLADGRRFGARRGTSLLDAALESGVMLEHGCRTGRCGSCRTRVVAGTTAALAAEPGIDTAAKAAGEVLACTREATSDVVLAAEDLSALAAAHPRLHPCRIDALERLAVDVLRVRLRLPPNAGFSFVAGQSVDLTANTAAGPVTRSYSIASAMEEPGAIELQIRRVAGGAMSEHLFERARRDDLLRLRGPLGSFVLRDVSGLDLTFLATGTGIAPVLSMLARVRALPAQARPASIGVYWGGRDTGDLYLDLAEHESGVRFVPVFSRTDERWRGERGHVQQALLRKKPDLSRLAVYACGSEAMVRDARATLVAAGLSPNRFFADAFVASGAPATGAAEDRE